MYLLLSPALYAADSLVAQWKNGLSGAKLTVYNGAVISSNSTLTVIIFCTNERYSYYKEGSWIAEGAASGASHRRIKGQWDIKRQQSSVLLSYRTDQGLVGTFPIYLQQNGRVNIAGVAYTAQKNAANCSL